MPRRLLVLFDRPLLLHHINLRLVLLRGVVHAEELVELLPALYLTGFRIASN